LVLRPAGQLVYVVSGDTVKAAPVTIGVRNGAYAEILTGLRADQRVAVRGAGFLTDGAKVDVREP
jgi:hypothetical protein